MNTLSTALDESMLESVDERIKIRWLNIQDYQTTWKAMQTFTQERDDQTEDEIWFLEHFPVFTQGQNGKPEHVLNPGSIPVIRTDRGGQVTYHGPGQLMIYTLIDLKRKKFGLRPFVSLLETSVIELLKGYGIQAFARPEAPGIYLPSSPQAKKIASIGLRIRKGCSYHGIALNVNLDLEPFTRINPCGFKQLPMTTFFAEKGLDNTCLTAQKLLSHLLKNLRYTRSIDLYH